VFRGVRRRGAAGRWVCEVRVPGNRGARLWLGTYVAAESAARAHDAAMLALGSVCLLAVPPPSALSGLDDARRAALEAAPELEQVPVKKTGETATCSTFEREKKPQKKGLSGINF